VRKFFQCYSLSYGKLRTIYYIIYNIHTILYFLSFKITSITYGRSFTYSMKIYVGLSNSYFTLLKNLIFEITRYWYKVIIDVLYCTIFIYCILNNKFYIKIEKFLLIQYLVNLNSLSHFSLFFLSHFFPTWP
jgi:hypothetical protein